jgi:hypothetical protein
VALAPQKSALSETQSDARANDSKSKKVSAFRLKNTGSNGPLVKPNIREISGHLTLEADPIHAFFEAASQVVDALRHYENETLRECCDDNQQDHQSSDGQIDFEEGVH